MGNCHQRKKKKRSSSHRYNNSNGSGGYSRNIRDGERQMMKGLEDRRDVSSTSGGVSFTVEIESGNIRNRPLSRLQKLEENCTINLSNEEIDEKLVKAELLREEKRANRRLKARQNELKRQDALKRRDAQTEEFKAKIEAKEKEHEKSIEERKRKLQELARKTKEARLRKARKAV